MSVLVDFSSEPVYCRQCGRRMRPTSTAGGVWRASWVVYGSGGRCVDCAALPSVEAPAEPAAAAVPGAPVEPVVRRERRRHRRFDYRPQGSVVCPSCGARYDPVAGDCRCSRERSLV